MSRFVPCVVALLLTWPSTASPQWPVTSCTTLGKNLFVRDAMSDIYLWHTELPGANPAEFDSPEAYLEAVRYRPLDTTFSYITSRAANDAFFDDSAYIGFGFSTEVAGDEMRVLQVFPDSPASEAGITRGARIVAIDGRAVVDLLAEGTLDSAFGPVQVGAESAVDFVLPTGGRRSTRLVKRVVTIPTVSLTRVYEMDRRRIGYVFFRNFVRPSNDALDAAFAQLAESHVDDLVLDLRYNGGGLVAVARHLASLIGGVRTRDQVFAQYVHNDRNTRRNQVLRFEDTASGPGFERLIVITTRSSASASELVINALRPFIPVVIVGDRTYGKPVGQYQIDFCDKMLAPVSFVVQNANGEGDYFEGLAPDCGAADEVDRELGDPAEASLHEAITFAMTGACTPRPRALERTVDRRRAPRAVGWQSVVNAY